MNYDYYRAQRRRRDRAWFAACVTAAMVALGLGVWTWTL